MLKVAIVGCGMMGELHAELLTQVAGCVMVAVCDQEPLMARQLYDRFPIKAWYSDLRELLQKARPDVVHIVTSPQTHFDLARICLEHGSHVYVEKPFTIDAIEEENIVRLATEKKLKVTVGNDAHFTHAARRFHEIVKTGYLGGAPMHMESYYCSELQDEYAKVLLGDRHHWVRGLPGQLLHNIISHGVVRIAEFMPDNNPKVRAHLAISPLLQSFGETELMDELRVIIAGQSGTTAYLTYSSQMRPSLRQFRVYGPANGLALDDDEQSVIKLRGTRFKSYAGKFLPPIIQAIESIQSLACNLNHFLHSDFHMKGGLKHLIEAFYRSITEDAPLPISHREIVLTCRIMDAIFAQIPKPAAVAARSGDAAQSTPVMVGA